MTVKTKITQLADVILHIHRIETINELASQTPFKSIEIVIETPDSKENITIQNWDNVTLRGEFIKGQTSFTTSFTPCDIHWDINIYDNCYFIDLRVGGIGLNALSIKQSLGIIEALTYLYESRCYNLTSKDTDELNESVETLKTKVEQLLNEFNQFLDDYSVELDTSNPFDLD